MFERFNDGARRVLVLAQEEARLLHHSFIGTEHLLLGLIHQGDGIAAQALDACEVSLEAAREQVREVVEGTALALGGSPPFTPRAKKVLELALREALQLNQSFIGTEHLLLGLLREGEGGGAAALKALGVPLGRVRRKVMELMSGGLGLDALRGAGGQAAERPPDPAPAWAAPVWDRPSEGTVPAVLAVEALLLQNDIVVVALDRLEVYPNGFMINLLMRVDPRRVGEMFAMLRPLGPHLWPRVAVAFADGRSAEPGIGPMLEVSKDEHGVPVEPFMSMGSRGGAPAGWRAWAWVFPLPPEGPLEIGVALESAGLSEARITLDGGAVREAAGRARVVWT